MPNLNPPIALVIERPAGVIEQAVLDDDDCVRWLYTLAQVVPLDHSTTWYVRRR